MKSLGELVSEADFLTKSLTKYDVRKVSIVSAYEPTAYALHITNK